MWLNEMAPSITWKVAAPKFSPCFVIIFSLISLFVGRSSSSCSVGSGKYDISALDWPPWNVTLKVLDTVTYYQLSLCRSLDAAAVPCKDSAICKYHNSEATNFGSYTAEPKFVEHEAKAGFTLQYEGSTCRSGRNYRTRIHFHCGPTLGSPSYVSSSSCTTDFTWQTSVACSKASSQKQVPCYIYDKEDRKHDLSFLSYPSGAHFVKSSQSPIGFFINVCSDIVPNGVTLSCPHGSAACRKIGSETVDFGQPTTPLSIDSNGNLRLEYVSNGTAPPGCDLSPRTTITFVCPRSSTETSIMKQIRGPTLTSLAECQYEVEWVTDHACPVEDQVNNKDCRIKDEERGIYADFVNLRKTSEPYHIPAIINGTQLDFYLNVCGSLRVDCNGTSSGATAVCMKSRDDLEGHILGSNSARTLRIYNGDVSLVYKGGEVCKTEPNSAVTTIINFRCNSTASNSQPTFDRMTDCDYIFEWETNLVCPQSVSAHQCIAISESKMADLSLLVKRENGSSSWDVVTSSVPDFAKSQIAINVCGSVRSEGSTANCPLGSAVCLKRSAASSVESLGRYASSPQFEGQNIILHYKAGSDCPDTKKKMESVITFNCKPGESDSGPYLAEVSADKCTFFFEWETSSACPVARFNGTNCVVYDKNLSITIDLTPLQKNGTFRIETDDYDYYLRICGAISTDPCDSYGEHSACQVSKKDPSQAWSLGSPSSNLQYFDGFVNLTYTNGTPYRGAEKNPRQTTISFLCNPSAGVGKPEFVDEANHTYSFKWYTSLVCPTNPIECVFVDKANSRQYDLSRLTRSYGQQNWEIVGNVNGKNKKFLLNICRPLVSREGCSSEAAACEVDVDNPEDVTNIGQATSGPYLDSSGLLTLHYYLGEKCEYGGPNKTYEAFIHFMCAEPSSNVESLRLSTHFGCAYTFFWETAAACPLSVETSDDNCSIKDSSTGVVYDLQSLRKNYTVVTKGDIDFQSFEISLCGAPLSDTCKASNGAKAAACGHRTEGNSQVLGVVKGAQLEVTQTGKLLVTYRSADYDAKTGLTATVVVTLLCRQDVTKELMRFTHQDASQYYFEMETRAACAPAPLTCSVVDGAGNTYDLSALARSDDNWRVEDSRADRHDLSYYINVCRPLIPIQGTDCAGSTLGACQTSTASGKSFNLGYIQGQPQVSASGDVTLRYGGGTPCHGGKFQRSTRINFHCSPIQHDPVFIDETEECEYIISWHTPAACPTKQTIGKSCSVDDPVYGHHFDLSPLKENGTYTVTGDDHTYLIGLCHAVACGSEKSAGVCQTKGDQAINAGSFSETIIFNDGALSVVYFDGKGNCHGKYNRSTEIQFRCSAKESSGPIFIKEDLDCSYLFLWETPLACVPAMTVECSARDDNGLQYDLSSLQLFNSSHEYVTPDGRQKFLINVCRSVSSSEVSARCEYSSGVCFVNMTEQDTSKKFVNLGSVRHEPYFENGILKLKYELGETCGDSHHEVIIAFHCDKSKLESEPSLLKREGCTWHFVWDTAAACPLNGVDEGKVRDDCKAINPATGFQYDLNPLKNSSGYLFEDNTGHKFVINVCAPVQINACSPKSGSCQFKDSYSWNAGEANSKLHLHEGGLFLNYTGGKKCHKDQFERSTIIRFICAQDAGYGSPVFMDESEDCTYYITWHTSLACEKQVHCAVNDGSRVIDLSPLTKEHHVASVGTGVGLFLINVCRPLSPIRGIPCPPEAAACKSAMGSSVDGAVNLGTVGSSPFIDSLGRVVLEYNKGSPCPADPTISTTTRIIFFCDEKAEEGVPELMHVTDNCKYIFKWLTSVVCQRDSSIHAVLPPSSSSCVFVDENTGVRFDLSALRSVPGTGHQVSGHEDFLISLCSPLNDTGLCAGAAVCNQSKSIGSAASVHASYQDSSLRLLFENGSSCAESDSGRWSATIEFICDADAGDGFPVIVDQFSCSISFHWKTNVVCSSLRNACTVFSGNQLYDLRRLASISHSWNFTDSEGNQYWINVCNGLLASDQNSGCPQDATVCVKNPEGKFYTLGYLETQKLSVDGDTADTVLLQYKGAASDFCEDGEIPETTLRLICSHERGTPAFISRKKCTFIFEWKTFVACPTNKKDEVLEWSKGIIHDKDFDVYIDLSQYRNKLFTSNEIRNKDNYTYELLLETNSLTHTTCGTAGVCQTKKGENFVKSIGLSDKAKFYRRGAELQMDLGSDTPCGKSLKRNNATTTIIFQCTTEDLKNPISFVYESMDCTYIFNWKTNAVCLWSSNSVGHIVDPSGGGKGQSTSTGAIFAVVGLVIFLLVLIGLLINNQTRRAVVVTALRRLWRRSRKSPVYRYSVLPSHDSAQNETTSLLNPEADGQHSLQAFHEDDSDDEVLVI